MIMVQLYVYSCVLLSPWQRCPLLLWWHFLRLLVLAVAQRCIIMHNFQNKDNLGLFKELWHKRFFFVSECKLWGVHWSTYFSQKLFGELWFVFLSVPNMASFHFWLVEFLLYRTWRTCHMWCCDLVLLHTHSEPPTSPCSFQLYRLRAFQCRPAYSRHN